MGKGNRDLRTRTRLLSSILAVTLLFTVLDSSGALASTLKDLQNEKKAVEQKKTNLNSNIQKKETEINSKQSSVNQLQKQIKKLNAKIDETNSNMNHLIKEINETVDEIDALQASIKDLETRIKERDAVLRERVRAMQVKGNQVSYLDVLLGANSFSDFIDRFSAVTTLFDADRKIIRQQEEDMAQLEKEKTLVEEKLAQQEERKAKLQQMKDSLNDQKKEKNSLISQLEAEKAKLAKEKQSLENEYDNAYKISKELENKIVSEQNRLAEVARKAEAERRAKANAAKSQRSSSSSSSSASSSHTGKLPAVSGGTWTRPTSGIFTSGFGWRTHPVFHTKKQHRGIDIAAPTGTPVVAAADGVVSYAGQMSGFGNVVMITHSVNGSIITTVYGHLSRINTSSGAHVSKGQLVGAVGSTGVSTGPHLHFEVHIGNFSAYGPSAVNPLRYVSL